MFTVLAIGVGVSHFTLGWSSNTVAFVRGNFHTPSFIVKDQH